MLMLISIVHFAFKFTTLAVTIKYFYTIVISFKSLCYEFKQFIFPKFLNFIRNNIMIKNFIKCNIIFNTTGN